MTDTRTYDVSGATLTVTTVLNIETINISMTLDLHALDGEEPDYSEHTLVNYIGLGPLWHRPNTYWWCKIARKPITCQTGSQAQRIVRHALATVADAISTALLDRNRRKAEMAVATAITRAI